MPITGLLAASASILLAIPTGWVPDAAPTTITVASSDPDCSWRLASAQLYVELGGLTDPRAAQVRALLEASGVGAPGFLPQACVSTSTGGDNSSSSPTTPRPPTGSSPPSGNYLFDDEFNGTALDASSWAVLNRPGTPATTSPSATSPTTSPRPAGICRSLPRSTPAPLARSTPPVPCSGSRSTSPTAPSRSAPNSPAGVARR